MSGGGGRPKGGKIAIGSKAPKEVDGRAAAAELAKAEAACGKAAEELKQASRVAHASLHPAPPWLIALPASCAQTVQRRTPATHLALLRPGV